MHIPFVTPLSRKYLHLGNPQPIEYSPNALTVTENPTLTFPDPVYRFGTERP